MKINFQSGITRCCILALLFTATEASAQAPDMTIFNSNMRSRAANQFYEEEFRTVGVYKVKGNSFLMRGNNVSDIFTNIGYGVNVALVYDTYKQELSVMLDDKKRVVKLQPEEVDSFYLKVDNEGTVKAPAMFLNMKKIDPSAKPYMQQMVKKGKYGLYKSYYADMVNAANDVAQTNVKAFEIRSDYYLLDNSTAETKLIKIKPKARNLKDMFKTNQAALSAFNNQAASYEENLVVFVEALNAQ